MNVVKFPGLNLRFEFSKIAFTIFGIDIYKYSICIVIGILVALVLCILSKEKFNNNSDFILENCIISLVFGLIGARLYYILFNLSYFLNNTSEILNFRNGGIAIYGGLFLGAISIIINCKKSKKDILNFFDCIIPFVSLGQSIGRFGNFFNIEAYGYECKSIIRMGIETLSGYMEVHPTFLYESALTFTIFLILRNIQKNRKFKGQIFLLYCILYSFIRFIIEGIRIDSLMLINFRISQMVSIFIFVISLVIYIYNSINKCRKMSYEK